MLFYNAGIFTACSGFIKNGYVLVRNGTIIDVGPMEFCPKDAESYDFSRLTIYPGFIDAHCHLGMWEDGLSFEGDDGNEDTDPATPHLSAIDAVNPGDYSFKEALDAGVTAVVTGPGSANPVAGQMVAIKTYGSCIDDMVIKAPLAMKFALGENPKNTYHGKDETPSTRMATAAIIREQLKKAQRYQRDILAAEEDEDTDEPEIDVKSEALAAVVDGSIQSHFHAHRSDDIFTAIRIAKEYELDLVLIHCTEGYLNAEKLASEKAKAVVGPMICTRTKPELSNERDENAAILKKAGVEVAICTDHPEVPIQYLPLSAGIAVRAGMDHDDAIRAITSVPAKIMGLSGKIGSVAPGKDADLVAFKGDPLSVYETPVWVIAGGKIVKKPK
ncbi:MAG: amidohydrolase [Oscillospiraceae bacterium]|nr:amidohydrolase [Oscillospiraceae bacterium]